MSTTTIVTIGIDLGKNSFHVIGLDRRGAIGFATKEVETSTGNLVGKYSCLPNRRGGLHRARDLGRKLETIGHPVRLPPAQYLKPYLGGS